MAFPINAVQIDFDGEITYGHDQANVTYPTVFPTVTFPLKPTNDLITLLKNADDFDPEMDCEFFTGINGFTKSKMDNCIDVVHQDDTWTIDLDEDTQKELFTVLDQQCKEHLGKGCDALLDEAKAQI